MNIGDTYTWAPAAFEGLTGIERENGKVRSVSGRIVYINEAHRYYTAEAECNGYKLRESFKY